MTETPPPAPPLAVQEPVSNIIRLHSESPEETARQEAADRDRAEAAQAVPFMWKGKTLAPFTPSREAAFHQHRSAIGAPEFRDAVADSVSFAADAARLLYFLSHEPKEWLSVLAGQRRGALDGAGQWQAVNAHTALEERICAWMDGTWTGTMEETVDAYVLCVDIMTRATATRARHADPADPDEVGN